MSIIPRLPLVLLYLYRPTSYLPSITNYSYRNNNNNILSFNNYSKLNALTISKFSSLANRIGNEEEINELKQFLNNFNISSIPVSTFDIRHARSSGAGGQHVNKVNTKVDMRFNLSQAKWLPKLAKKILASTESNRINSSGEFVITSSKERSQQDNYNDCIQKLYTIIKENCVIDSETSEETKEKVEYYKQRANSNRLKEKQKAKQRKSSRRDY